MEINDSKKNIPRPTMFGANLKYLRSKNSLSQAELAKKLGINRNNIASYESGSAEPNAARFIDFCSYFSVNPLLMLDSDLSTIHVDTIKSSTNDVTTQENIIESFVDQTNEMNTILQGYKAFFEMKKEKNSNPEHVDLYHTLDDLLSLLKSLILSNQNLINNIIINEEE